MSESDILAIQLWLGAAAIAFMAIAMAAAGWNHKYFVRVMFSIAAFVAVVAIFWRQIRLWISDQSDDLMLMLANNRFVWLAMFIAGIATILAIAKAKRPNKAPSGPGPVPTSIRLQFNLGDVSPICIDEKNIWRWYALAQIIQGVSVDGKTQTKHKFWLLFLVFSEPVDFKEIRINGGGAKLPMHEVKDSGPRHAIIYFNGNMEGMVLDVSTELRLSE